MGTIRSAGATAILLSLFTHPAAAADFVNIIGAGAKNDENNASIASVPFSGVAAGNSIIVTLQASGLDGELSCSDPVNGTYDADVTSGEAADGRIAIASKHNVLALQFGDLITCTYPLFFGASSIGAYEFSVSSRTTRSIRRRKTPPPSRGGFFRPHGRDGSGGRARFRARLGAERIPDSDLRAGGRVHPALRDGQPDPDVPDRELGRAVRGERNRLGRRRIGRHRSPPIASRPTSATA